MDVHPWGGRCKAHAFVALTISLLLLVRPITAASVNVTAEKNITTFLNGTYELIPFDKGIQALRMGVEYAREIVEKLEEDDEEEKPRKPSMFYSKKLVFGTCPERLQFDVRNVTTGLIFQLTAPADPCVMNPFLSNPVLTMNNQTVQNPVFNKSAPKADLPGYMSDQRLSFSASFKDLLKCESKTFPHLNISDFVQHFTSRLTSPDRGLEIGDAQRRYIFGNVSTGYPAKSDKLPAGWKSPYVTAARKDIREALEEIGKVPLLYISRTLNESAAAQMDHNRCFYVKNDHDHVPKNPATNSSANAKPPTTTGYTVVKQPYSGPVSAPTSKTGPATAKNATQKKPKSAIEEFKDNLEEVYESFVPVVLKTVLKPFEPSPAKFKLTDHKCKLKSDVIRTIELMKPRRNKFSSYDQAWTVPISINGKECTKGEFSRFLEAESFIKEDQVGKMAVEKVDGLLPHLLERLFKNKTVEEKLEENGLEEYVEELRESIAKTLASVAGIDVSDCESLEDKKGLGILVVDIPTEKLCGDARVPFNCDDLKKGMTAIVIRDPEEDPCLYTTSEELKANVPKTEALPLPHTKPNKPGKSQNSQTPQSTQNGQYPPQVLYGQPQPRGKSGQNPPYGQSGQPPQIGQYPPNQPGPVVPKGRGGDPTGLEQLLACFPARATVLLADGRRVPMRELRLGDYVEVSPEVFSPVLLFTHATSELRTEMSVIESASGKLVASPTHYVLSNNMLVAAGEVQVGDLIAVKTGDVLRSEVVIKVGSEVMTGLYNPHTKAGTILVEIDGYAAVAASVYTTAISPFVAHLLMAPLRWVHNVFGASFPGISALFPDTHVERTASLGHIIAKLAFWSCVQSFAGLK